MLASFCITCNNIHAVLRRYRLDREVMTGLLRD
jgi:hypothetical protein